MKNLKKIIALALVSTLALGVLTIPASASDTPATWAAEDVNTAIDEGLVPTELQSSYSEPITRAEFCALVVTMYETVVSLRIAGRETFTDTRSTDVRRAAFIKVVEGYGDGTFGPDDELTREQAATMLMRLADAVGKPFAKHSPTFADNILIHGWAIEGVGACQAAGIMQGVGDNRFAPDDPYTREQSIVTILRTYNAVGGKPLTVRLSNTNLTNAQLAMMVQNGEIPAGVERLILHGNPISDLTPLKSLTSLISLGINETQVSDLSPLSSLTGLKSLSLDGNKISDLTPLRSLTNLVNLWLGNNIISDLAPLSALTNLELLVIDNNNISDVSPLSSLTGLYQLWVIRNQVKDVSPLASLTNLVILDISNNSVANIAPLASLTRIVQLTLSSNQIEDVTPLKALARMQNLNLTRNPLTAEQVAELKDQLPGCAVTF